MAELDEGVPELLVPLTLFSGLGAGLIRPSPHREVPPGLSIESFGEHQGVVVTEPMLVVPSDSIVAAVRNPQLV